MRHNNYAAKVGIAGENDLFANNSILSTNKHYYYETSNVCDGEYVYKSGTEMSEEPEPGSIEERRPSGFVSVVNATEESIDKLVVELILRDIVYHKDAQKNTSQNRAIGLEFEDLPESATRQLNWDSAFSFCESLTLNGDTNWRLPSTRDLQNTWYQNRLRGGSFAYSSFEDYYWTSNGNTSNTAYSTVKGDGRHAEVASNSGGYISKGLTRNVRCVRDTSNVCEIDPL